VVPDAVGPKPKRLIATYFDTPDLALNKAGYALRHTSRRRKRVQTVKSVSSGAAGLFVRGEWETSVRSDDPVIDAAAGPLALQLDETRARGLRRSSSPRSSVCPGPIESATATIEYAVDTGEVCAGQRSMPLSELELELQKGPPERLFDFARGPCPKRFRSASASDRSQRAAMR